MIIPLIELSIPTCCLICIIFSVNCLTFRPVLKKFWVRVYILYFTFYIFSHSLYTLSHFSRCYVYKLLYLFISYLVIITNCSIVVWLISIVMCLKFLVILGVCPNCHLFAVIVVFLVISVWISVVSFWLFLISVSVLGFSVPFFLCNGRYLTIITTDYRLKSCLYYRQSSVTLLQNFKTPFFDLYILRYESLL